MSASKEVSAHIPYLRRFARALVGDREGGDAYVLATLETVVAEPSRIANSDDLRVAVYRLFLDVWAASPINAHTDRSGALAENGRRNLDAISLKPRIAFLLQALEGFDLDQIGQTLQVSERRGRRADRRRKWRDRRPDRHRRADHRGRAADRARPEEHRRGARAHRVVGMPRTHAEAVAAIEESNPGLILADIQLADGSSGLDAVNEILGSLSTPVIFVTAYPERFLTGEPPEPAFLIAKPFNVESLKAVISQALFFDRRAGRT